jgi:hypothetical protein
VELGAGEWWRAGGGVVEDGGRWRCYGVRATVLRRTGTSGQHCTWRRGADGDVVWRTGSAAALLSRVAGRSGCRHAVAETSGGAVESGDGTVEDGHRRSPLYVEDGPR